jgi:DNA modification methylase
MSLTWRILVGDVRERLRDLPDGSVQTCVTSPPYWGLRDYGHAGQIGLEPTPEAFVSEMVAVFAEVRRVLAEDGTVWLNLGDSYANDTKWGGSSGGKHVTALHGNSGIGRGRRDTGLKGKDLCGIPWRVAFALQADGWYLRSDIIWSKPNPMPESVTDRPTKAHEYLFLLSKRASYYYDAEAIAEAGIADRNRGGNAKMVDAAGIVLGRETNPNCGLGRKWEPDGTRNKRSVWHIATQPYPEAHFATFPEALIEPCILAGSKPGDTVLDPFNGSGTTGAVAIRHQRNYIGVELNPAYVELAEKRIGAVAPLFAVGEVA